MGFLVGILRRILKLILAFAIIVALILLIPNLPPYTKFTGIEIEPTQPLVGPLAPNNVLNNPERLYEDKLLGPEAFQIWNGEVYTGLATGEVVKVSQGGHVTFVTKIGQPCTGLIQEHICGRPLGITIDEPNKLMYIADAYHGIWKVNIVTDKKQLLVSPRVSIDGKIPKLFNAVALDKNGNLYWTQSSSDFPLRDGLLTFLADPSGRLFHYNAAKNESKVLLDNLWFPNGLTVSPDNQFIVVVETIKLRLLKYYVDGPKKGSSEVFASGLPGFPDNVRPLPDGSGVLVALYNAFVDDHPNLVKSMAAAPLARKFLARLIRLIEIPFEFLNSQVPHHIFEEIIHYIGSFGSISKLSSGTSGLVQLDWNGNIVAAYYNTDGKIHSISDAIVFNDKLYLGAPHIQNFIGAVPAPALLKKAFAIKQLPVKEQPKARPDQNKRIVEEKKDIPKVNKPVEKKDQPEVKIHQNAPKEVPQEAKKQPQAEKQNEQIKAQAPVKYNALPKEVPKTKEAEIKTNQIPKAAEIKSKNLEKEAQNFKEPAVQAKPIPNESEVKPKVVPKMQEKPIEAKRPDTKPKVQEKRKEEPIKPVTSPTLQEKVKQQSKVQEKPKEEPKKQTVSPQVPEKVKVQTKIQEKPKEEPKKPVTSPKTQEKVSEQPKVKETPKQSETKPKIQEIPKEAPKLASKETEPKTKTTKEADVKPKMPKEQKNPQTINNEKKSKDNPKISEKPNAKSDKEIPVEEIIPSDTAKPSKDKLKVIKRSGPQEIPSPYV